MLSSFRKYTNSLIVKLMLGFLVVTFLIWGIGDVIRSASKDYVAKVGGEYIMVGDYIESYKRQVQQLRTVYPNLNPQQLKAMNLSSVVIRQLVTNKLLELEAQNLGIIIDDSIILDVISKNPLFAGPDGKFDPEKFKRVLSYNGIVEQEYVTELKNQVAVKMLTDTLDLKLTPSKNLIEAVNNYNNQKANIKLFTVDPQKIALSNFSEDILQQYYQNHLADFTTAEYRDLEYVVITPETYQSKVNVSDQELQQEYNQVMSNNADQKQYDYYDVLFPSKEDAEAALQDVKQGKDFDQVVIQYTGQQAKDFLLNKKNTVQLPEHIKSEINKLSEGDVSPVLNGELGYHFLKLLKISNPQNNDSAKLRQEIKDHMLAQKIEEMMYSDVKSLEDDLSAGKNLAEISKEYGLKLEQLSMVDSAGANRQGTVVVPSYSNFVEEAFKLPEQQTSEMLSIDDSAPGYFIVSTKKIYPQQQKSFAEVKSTIIKQMTQSAQLTQANNLLQEFKKNRKQDELLKNPAATVKERSVVRIGGDLSPELIQAFFSLKPEEYSEIFILPSGEYAIAQLTSITNGDVKLTSEESGKLQEMLAYGFNTDLISEYMNYLEDKYKVAIHEDVLAQIEM